jgi:hypothetical protein
VGAVSVILEGAQGQRHGASNSSEVEGDGQPEPDVEEAGGGEMCPTPIQRRRFI